MSNSATQSEDFQPASTIMVVEPEILIRMVIADYLRECGFKVIEGINANDVFGVLRSPDADKIEAATLVDLCHMLINANEFVYRN